MAQTNNLALVFDFDKTLTEEYQQAAIFENFDYDENKFWGSVDQEYDRRLEEDDKRKKIGIFGPKHTLCYETTYADVLVDYAQKGTFSGLNLDRLFELGKEIKFHPGVPEFMPRLKEFVEDNKKWREHNINLEFYVISCGIEEMIKGSIIAPYLTGLFATKFGENERGISRTIHAISYTEKTKFLYQINKGPSFSENAFVPDDSRRIDRRNMLYVGDGPSDIPCFATLKDMNGETMGVYCENDKAFREASLLVEQGRVPAIAPADYNENTHLDRYFKYYIGKMADRTAKEIKEKIAKVTGLPPKP